MTRPTMLHQIRAAMAEQHMTQADLAKRCGTSQPAISAIMAGARQPTMGLAQRMMAALGLEVVRSQRRLTREERG